MTELEHRTDFELTKDTKNLLTHLPLGKMAPILADDIFKSIFLNEKYRILIKISLKFVPRSPIDNKPLPEPVVTQFTDAYMENELNTVSFMSILDKLNMVVCL